MSEEANSRLLAEFLSKIGTRCHSRGADRQRDRSGQPDGVDHLRHAAIAASARL